MHISAITFDAHEPAALAAFWAAVLERPVSESPSEFFAVIERTPTSPAVTFIKVPEGKVAKNRMHLDVACDDIEAARGRLEGLGATFVHEKNEYGARWFTLRDPEGNEFCISSNEVGEAPDSPAS